MLLANALQALCMQLEWSPRPPKPRSEPCGRAAENLTRLSEIGRTDGKEMAPYQMDRVW